ncbi:MAG: YceI family protein [Patescibacteria group bacterium]|jgi:polyisoprenoid-binding protein YceI
MTLKSKLIALAVLGVAVAGGAYLYITRPVAAPSTPAANLQTEPEAPVAANFVRYRIDPSSSRAIFRLDEVLRGEPKTVVGETNQVTGDILLDVTTPSNSRVEEVRVNARTLQTDSSARDGAISRLILRSEQPENEFIVFKPTAFEGLPERIASDSAFGFRVTGDLTIAGITKSVTFQGSATIDETGRLVGTAATTVKRADFNLVIPSVPFVANVQEEVNLQLQFAAVKLP